MIRKIAAASICLATAFLASGCASPVDPANGDFIEITQSERIRLAKPIPGEDWMVYLQPELVATFSKSHFVCQLKSIGAPVLEDGLSGEYVPLRVYCMQGMSPGTMTFRYSASWDPTDAILRLEKGQRLLISARPPYEDNKGNVALLVSNIYLLADDGTMSVLDESSTVVGNFSDFQDAFGLN